MKTQPVTFAAMTDLHLDIMHDGMMRIDAFLDAAQKADVDFIIQLGDFSYPKDTSTCLCAPEKMPINLKYAMECPTEIPKLEILNKFNLFSKPKYHLLGNHECDFAPRQMLWKCMGWKSPITRSISKAGTSSFWTATLIGMNTATLWITILENILKLQTSRILENSSLCGFGKKFFLQQNPS